MIATTIEYFLSLPRVILSRGRHLTFGVSKYSLFKHSNLYIA